MKWKVITKKKIETVLLHIVPRIVIVCVCGRNFNLFWRVQQLQCFNFLSIFLLSITDGWIHIFLMLKQLTHTHKIKFLIFYKFVVGIFSLTFEFRQLFQFLLFFNWSFIGKVSAFLCGNCWQLGRSRVWLRIYVQHCCLKLRKFKLIALAIYLKYW